MIMRRRVAVPIADAAEGVKPDGRGKAKKVNSRLPPQPRTIPKPPASKSDPAAVAERKRIFLEAYVVAMCNVSLACNNCGIAHSTVYNWRKADPEFAKEMDDRLEIRIDFYENALDKSAQGGNIAAIAFFLKCRAKSRGYVERTEITGPGGKPMQLAVSRDEFTDPALRSALARMAQDDPEFAKRLSEGLGKE